MAMFIVNPGTEFDPSATLANAEAIAAEISREIGLQLARASDRDNPARGYFGFRVGAIDLDIPGDEPSVFFESRPFVSRRMYVDGSSWLWGFGLGIIADKLERGEP